MDRRAAPLRSSWPVISTTGHTSAARRRHRPASWQRLVAAARAADPDPWRDKLRANVAHRDPAAAEVFRKLADDPETLQAQPTASVLLLALQLKDLLDDRARAERVLRQAWHRDPGDYWINYELGHVREVRGMTVAQSYPEPVEAVRFLSAAVAARPRSPLAHSRLASALLVLEKLDEATAEYRVAVRLNPGLAMAHSGLSGALHDQRKYAEAASEVREALRLYPESSTYHNNLASALDGLGKLDEAIAEFREALRLYPANVVARSNLGNALRARGDMDEALAELHEALRQRPELPRGAPTPRLRPSEAGKARGGDRRVPRGAAAEAEQGRGPRRARRRPPCRGPAR